MRGLVRVVAMGLMLGVHAVALATSAAVVGADSSCRSTDAPGTPPGAECRCSATGSNVKCMSDGASVICGTRTAEGGVVDYEWCHWRADRNGGHCDCVSGTGPS